ncbi:MAG TPA: 2-oxoacid:acceptor oxidoreductase subunit alpha, partial [candidate division WOR-3 bacterium]|nr:2-oxoacid:acceptor oxidoreductase subunit alpha [candidate division WOR-3 bacterium]
LVALAPGLVRYHTHELSRQAVVLVDDEHGGLPGGGFRVFHLPLHALAVEHGGERTSNSVALGAVAAMLDLDFALLEQELRTGFDGRNREMAEKNVRSARGGYDACRKRSGPLARLATRPVPPGRRLITGADALALGAIAGGARYATGYPMSPGSGVLEACARYADRAGLIVEQAEDEVAAINQACGAAFGGAPALVATAGGGLCLMNEGLSLAGMTETGVVVMSGMRPGPATGLATRTAQADLLFVLTCGHGEFPRAVLCPADGAAAFRAAAKAVRLAERYQAPVILLFDQWLADARWTIGAFEFETAPGPDRYEGPAGEYRRYRVTDSGISPRILPGTPGELVYVDSDEHTEEGHITESAEVRNAMVEKRARKAALLAREIAPPERWPDEDAEALIACFGSTRGPVREAVARLRRTGRSVAVLHFGEVWPFPAAATIELARRSRRLFTVEGNATAQLGQLLAQECGLRVEGSVLRYDGRQFRVAEVREALARKLGEK